LTWVFPIWVATVSGVLLVRRNEIQPQMEVPLS
jgi:hypothetical protein